MTAQHLNLATMENLHIPKLFTERKILLGWFPFNKATVGNLFEKHIRLNYLYIAVINKSNAITKKTKNIGNCSHCRIVISLSNHFIRPE